MDDETFAELVEGVGQMRAHARGEQVPGVVVHVPVAVDAATIRRATGLSQDAFARTIGVAVGTLRGWEQGRRQPEGPARVLLALLDKNPRLVEEMLGQPAVASSRRAARGGTAA